MKSLFGNPEVIKKMKNKKRKLIEEDEMEDVTYNIIYEVCCRSKPQKYSSVVKAHPEEEDDDVANRALDTLWKREQSRDESWNIEDIEIVDFEIIKKEKKEPKDTETLNMFENEPR